MEKRKQFLKLLLGMLVQSYCYWIVEATLVSLILVGSLVVFVKVGEVRAKVDFSTRLHQKGKKEEAKCGEG